MKEIWKEIKGYPNYMVSNWGRVKSLERVIIKNNGKSQTVYEKILKDKKDKDGYVVVSLYDDEHKMKNGKVHRLVAEAFIPNPNNLPCINHKNELKDDNRVENLEYCTNEYNLKYGNRLSKTVEKISRKCYQYDLGKNLLNVFSSTQEATRATGILNSNITACCRGEYKSTHGYIFSYQSL